MNEANQTTTLYRPFGPEELVLIEQSGFTAFPTSIPEQPLFYPTTYGPYAEQVARDCYVRASGAGYVTRFPVRSNFYRLTKNKWSIGQCT